MRLRAVSSAMVQIHGDLHENSNVNLIEKCIAIIEPIRDKQTNLDLRDMYSAEIIRLLDIKQHILDTAPKPPSKLWKVVKWLIFFLCDVYYCRNVYEVIYNYRSLTWRHYAAL